MNGKPETVQPCSFQASVPHGGAGAIDPRPGLLGSVIRFIRAVKRVRRRRQAIAQLRSLSDRTLGDLGIERDRIPEVVDVMQERDGERP